MQSKRFSGMYPDFLCIGAQKAGTTWLHDNLRQHPQVWLPPVKELHYFDHAPPSLARRLLGKTEIHRTARKHLRHKVFEVLRTGRTEGLAWATRYCLAPRNDTWYESLFPRIEGKVTGEVCPGYARVDAAAVGEIRRRMPDTKIIYLLRDPIDRAWSSTVMHFRKPKFGGIHGIDDERIRAHLSSRKMLAHSDYVNNLDAWRQHYPAEQLFVGYFDELSADPGKFLQKILAFLGLESSEVVLPQGVSEKRNAGQGEPIPQRFHPLLVDLHYDRIVKLDQTLKNAFTKDWLQAAESLRQSG